MSIVAKRSPISTTAELLCKVTTCDVFGRPFVKRFAYAIGPLSVFPVCLSVCLPVTLVYCGQTVEWTRMSLGTEIGLDPGDIVLDGDPARPTKEAQQPPLFGPCLLWPNNRPSQQLLSFCFIIVALIISRFREYDQSVRRSWLVFVLCRVCPSVSA